MRTRSACVGSKALFWGGWMFCVFLAVAADVPLPAGAAETPSAGKMKPAAEGPERRGAVEKPTQEEQLQTLQSKTEALSAALMAINTEQQALLEKLRDVLHKLEKAKKDEFHGEGKEELKTLREKIKAQEKELKKLKEELNAKMENFPEIREWIAAKTELTEKLKALEKKREKLKKEKSEISKQIWELTVRSIRDTHVQTPLTAAAVADADTRKTDTVLIRQGPTNLVELPGTGIALVNVGATNRVAVPYRVHAR